MAFIRVLLYSKCIVRSWNVEKSFQNVYEGLKSEGELFVFFSLFIRTGICFDVERNFSRYKLKSQLFARIVLVFLKGKKEIVFNIKSLCIGKGKLLPGG